MGIDIDRPGAGELPDGRVPVCHVRAGLPDAAPGHDGGAGADRGAPAQGRQAQRRLPQAAGGPGQQAQAGQGQADNSGQVIMKHTK